MMHPAPTTACSRTCASCQMLLPSPIWALGSTLAELMIIPGVLRLAEASSMLFGSLPQPMAAGGGCSVLEENRRLLQAGSQCSAGELAPPPAPAAPPRSTHQGASARSPPCLPARPAARGRTRAANLL